MPRAQNVAVQPSNLIDGHATLLASHAIFSTPKTPSDRSCTMSSGSKHALSSTPRPPSDRSRISSGSGEDEDESMHSADSDSCNGSLDSIDLPLQAHLLPGRGRCLGAVLPVLLVADACNIVPLICSTLYQRHVWEIRQPVVGLCCSSSGTIATAIFGWLDFDDSEEDHMASSQLIHVFFANHYSSLLRTSL